MLEERKAGPQGRGVMLGECETQIREKRIVKEKESGVKGKENRTVKEERQKLKKVGL